MRALITDDLTNRGITKPVTLNAELRHHGERSVGAMVAFNKGKWMGIVASTTVQRSEYRIDSFIPAISDKITISINAELKMCKKN